MSQAEDSRRFRVALTADFYGPDGDRGTATWASASSRRTPGSRPALAAEHRPEIDPAQIAGARATVVLTPRRDGRTVVAEQRPAGDRPVRRRVRRGGRRRLHAADVAVFITSGAVDRSVAEATVGWMIALSHNLLVKDSPRPHRTMGRAVDATWAASFASGPSARSASAGSAGAVVTCCGVSA